ncbi:type II toxin-antitoxin system HicB family antitoxin [Candidatus Parcubacteria bacterium]|nr:type II toxin-antitoxin system HicB family antitoxin [Candidatus Parcubacteria bacterium]
MLKKKNYKYTAVFEPAEEGGYVVYIPALPGCVTQGETFEEAKQMAEDAVAGYLSVLSESKQEIPAEKQGITISEIFARVPIKKVNTI